MKKTAVCVVLTLVALFSAARENPAPRSPENPCEWITECSGGICRVVLICS